MYFHVDTGSTDVWLIDVGADKCTNATVQASSQGGCFGGTFDSSKSSTFKTISKDGFQTHYGDDTRATGDFISDDLAIGGATVKQLQMGLGHNLNVSSGMLGLSYDNVEAAVADALKVNKTVAPYPSFVDQLVAQGLTNLKSYSTYLSQKVGAASLLFGGVDTSKYTGTLTPFPVQISPIRGGTQFTDLAIILDSISLTDEQGKKTVLIQPGSSLKAIVDTGYQPITVPDAVYKNIKSYAGAQTFSEGGISVTAVDCAIVNALSKSYMTFTFGSNGFKIDIPIGNLLADLGISQANAEAYGSPWNETCRFAMDSTVGNKFEVPFLGVTFLESVYANFDLSNNQVSLARATFNNASAGQILELPASGVPAGEIPAGATKVSASGTSTASPLATLKSGAVSRTPAFGKSGLVVLIMSVFFAASGAAIFLS